VQLGIRFSRKTLTGLAFLSPTFALMGLIVGLPFCFAIYLSFHSYQLNKPSVRIVSVGFQNYQRLLIDPAFWNALWNTTTLTVAAVGLQLLFGVSLALLVATFRRGRFTEAVRTILILPMMFTPVIVAILWRMIYDASYGPLNYLLRVWWGMSRNWLGNPTTSLWAVMQTDVWQHVGFVFLITFAGLETIPRELYEAADIDGATARQVLSKITLPLLRPYILISLALRTVDAFRIFDKVFVLTMGGPGTSSETLSLYAYRVAFRSYDLGYSATISLTVALVLLIVSGLYTGFIRSGKR